VRPLSAEHDGDLGSGLRMDELLPWYRLTRARTITAVSQPLTGWSMPSMTRLTFLVDAEERICATERRDGFAFSFRRDWGISDLPRVNHGETPALPGSP
jgi:hypothetical protein